MNRFECSGWLHIAATPHSTEMTIKIRHDESHEPYTDIALPEKYKEYIRENALNQTPGQVRF